MTTQFRTDVNGLRAISVVGVIAYHFGNTGITGGFSGVDVFFVISGFLMTKIIANGLEAGTFSFKLFYISRVKRIIPALLFLLTVFSIIFWFNSLNTTFYSQLKHLFSSLVFLSNVLYWSESGYFSSGVYEKWFLHTWSLSVEWQFYILYPFFLYLLFRYYRKSLRIFIVFVVIFSTLFSLYCSQRWADASYFLLPTRAWEMFLGGIAFYYSQGGLTSKKRIFLSYLGVVLIIYSFFEINKPNSWPNILTIIPCIGAFFVLISDYKNNVILNNPVSELLGKLSYSLYLWHWPIIVYLYQTKGINLYSVIYSLGLMLIMSIFSFYFIERIRNLRVIVFIYTFMLLFSFVGIMKEGEFQYRELTFDKRNLVIDRYSNFGDHEMDPSGLFEDCNASLRLLNTGSVEVAERCLDKRDGGVLLWGDSHLGSISYGLRQIDIFNDRFSQLTSSGCNPSFNENINPTNLSGRSKAGCIYSNKKAYSYLKKYPKDTVILAMRRFHYKSHLHETIKILKDELSIPNIIIIGPLPQWSPSLPLIYVNRHYGESKISDFGFDNQVIIDNNFMSELYLDNGDFIFIDLIDKLCSSDLDVYKCNVKFENELSSFDYGHLTPEASKYIAEHFLYPIIKNTL